MIEGHAEVLLLGVSDWDRIGNTWKVGLVGERGQIVDTLSCSLQRPVERGKQRSNKGQLPLVINCTKKDYKAVSDS
jgi:hypothetical protein